MDTEEAKKEFIKSLLQNCDRDLKIWSSGEDRERYIFTVKNILDKPFKVVINKEVVDKSIGNSQ